MKATLFTTALALASTAFALPQGPPPPQTYEGGNSGGNTEDSPVDQGQRPPPSYGQSQGGLGSSPQGIQTNQAGSGQPGNGIESPVNQPANNIQPQGNQGGVPGSVQPSPNGNTNQKQPGNGIGSPIEPQGNQAQVGGGGQLPPGFSPNSVGSQPGRGGIGGTQAPAFGSYHPNQNGNGPPSYVQQGPNGVGPQGLGPQNGRAGGQTGQFSPQSNNGIGSPVGQQQQPGPFGPQSSSPQGLSSQNGQFGGQSGPNGQHPGQFGPQSNNGIGSPIGQQGGQSGPQSNGQHDFNGQQPGQFGPQSGNRIGSPVGSGPSGQLGQPPLGAPTGDHICGPSAGGNCISEQEAELFIQRFIAVVSHQNSDLGDAETTANQIIGDDWVEHSNSILSLQGLPLTGDGTAAHSKQEWTQGILHAPPFGGIQTLKLLVFCDQVLWYWNFEAIGSGQYPVKGFNLFTMTRQGNDVVASEVDIEFDSIAWGLDTGFSVTLRDGRTLPEGGPSQQPLGGQGGQPDAQGLSQMQGQRQGQGQGQGGFGASAGMGGAGGLNANMGVGGAQLGVGQNGVGGSFAGAGARGPNGGVSGQLSQSGGAGGGVGGGAGLGASLDQSGGGQGGDSAQSGPPQ